MSKKKNRKQIKIEKLQALREKAVFLESEISKQKVKNHKLLKIRNLKIFGKTCNFLAPFVISTGLTVGVVKLCGGGFPFYVDEDVNYKIYNLDYQTNGYLTMDEYYTEAVKLPENELVIYTPFEHSDNQYTRYKRQYEINEVNILDLFDAIIEEDYAYIEENLKEYKEETQIINNIDENEWKEYYIKASLHMLDKNDVLKYNETEFENTITTILDLVIGLGIGALVTHFRNFEYLRELRYINWAYHLNVKPIKPMQEELTMVNEKILSLSKGKRDKK